MAETSNAFDRSLKILLQEVPGAIFRLAGVEVAGAELRTEDVTVNLPEHRADQVVVVGSAERGNRWALHLEYQLQPDPRQLPGWFLKNAALTVQLGMPVILVVLYLRKGDRAAFPESYRAEAEGLENEFRFETIRLWEHTERIRGELPELAPLLVLCEDRPNEATFREEVRLVTGLDVPPKVRADLLSIALTLASRFFSRDLLFSLIDEEIQMLKEPDLFEEWLQHREARVEIRTLRDMALDLLRDRFGELSEVAEQRVLEADAGWCRALILKIPHASSLEELGL